MKRIRGLVSGCLWLVAAATQGQVTNVGVAETYLIRMEWAAMPANPYRVYASPDLVAPAWSNLTPAGLVFSNSAGIFETAAGDSKTFYCVLGSDYLIVDLAAGPEATHYPVRYTNGPPSGGWGDGFKTTQLVLRRIPAGTFTMGSPTNELGRDDDEPLHAVTLTKDFYIGVFEVTQKQWERVMGNWPSYFSNATYRESRPVEEISYNDIRGTVAGTNWPADGNVDAAAFMGKLRARTGQAFDLPTEAQWEVACRAGTTTALASGFDLTNTLADAHLDVVGCYWNNHGAGYTSTGTTAVGTAKVGSYQANAWGLYDMHGNVWEWSLDRYEALPAGVSDPPGPAVGANRVLRGGTWSGTALGSRSANRFSGVPSVRFYDRGFRVFLPLGPL